MAKRAELEDAIADIRSRLIEIIETCDKRLQRNKPRPSRAECIEILDEAINACRKIQDGGPEIDHMVASAIRACIGTKLNYGWRLQPPKTAHPDNQQLYFKLA
jgi:hypothetical protein